MSVNHITVSKYYLKLKVTVFLFLQQDYFVYSLKIYHLQTW